MSKTKKKKMNDLFAIFFEKSAHYHAQTPTHYRYLPYFISNPGQGI